MKKDLVLSLVTGIGFALAMPPFCTGFLAYGVLIPFFILIHNKNRFNATVWGYITGFFISFACLFWIGFVTVPGIIGALLVLPLFFALYALVQNISFEILGKRAIFLAPFFWTCIEYLQSLGDTAFPWMYLGYTQTYYLPAIQMAEFTSVFGIGFWIVLLNVMIYDSFFLHREKRTVRLLILGVVFLMPILYGLIAMQAGQNGRNLRIAMVQGNVDPFEKWNANNEEKHFVKYDSLSRIAIESNPDLIIWPETATPFYLRYEFTYLDRIKAWVDSCSIPLLTGSIDYEYTEQGYQYYNAALLIEPHRVDIQHYAKHKLVPFSEKVPYNRYFPFRFLKRVLYDLQIGIGDYTRGQRQTVFSFPVSSSHADSNKSRINFSCAICYESVFPDYTRRFVLNGIEFLTIITNDAWFGRTTAPYQHAQIATLRAVENRISIARCANTGITCFIDPYGRVYDKTDIFTTEVVVNDLPLEKSTTFYTKHGNWVARLSSLVSLLLLLFLPVFRMRFGKSIPKGTLNRQQR